MSAQILLFPGPRLLDTVNRLYELGLESHVHGRVAVAERERAVEHCGVGVYRAVEAMGDDGPSAA